MKFNDFIGKRVLIRTYSAGVHYGMLTDSCPGQVVLVGARRIWRWEGALSLNEIANTGVNVEYSKITEVVEGIHLQGVIETILINKNSNLP